MQIYGHVLLNLFRSLNTSGTLNIAVWFEPSEPIAVADVGSAQTDAVSGSSQDVLSLADEIAGTLFVFLEGAANLSSKDMIGNFNPYVQLCLLPDPSASATYKSRKIEKDTSPIWKQSFSWSTSSLSALYARQLEIRVMDENFIQTDELAGMVVISLQDLPVYKGHSTTAARSSTATPSDFSSSTSANYYKSLLRSYPLFQPKGLMEAELALVSLIDGWSSSYQSAVKIGLNGDPEPVSAELRGFGEWIYLGDESNHKTYTVPAKSRIRYGKGSCWTEKLLSGKFTANNKTFGDVLPGRLKEVQIWWPAGDSALNSSSGGVLVEGSSHVCVYLDSNGPVKCLFVVDGTEPYQSNQQLPEVPCRQNISPESSTSLAEISLSTDEIAKEDSERTSATTKEVLKVDDQSASFQQSLPWSDTAIQIATLAGIEPRVRDNPSLTLTLKIRNAVGFAAAQSIAEMAATSSSPGSVAGLLCVVRLLTSENVCQPVPISHRSKQADPSTPVGTFPPLPFEWSRQFKYKISDVDISEKIQLEVWLPKAYARAKQSDLHLRGRNMNGCTGLVRLSLRHLIRPGGFPLLWVKCLDPLPPHSTVGHICLAAHVTQGLSSSSPGTAKEDKERLLYNDNRPAETPHIIFDDMNALSSADNTCSSKADETSPIPSYNPILEPDLSLSLPLDNLGESKIVQTDSDLVDQQPDSLTSRQMVLSPEYVNSLLEETPASPAEEALSKADDAVPQSRISSPLASTLSPAGSVSVLTPVSVASSSTSSDPPVIASIKTESGPIVVSRPFNITDSNTAPFIEGLGLSIRVCKACKDRFELDSQNFVPLSAASEEWLSDKQSTQCMSCASKFSLSKRRHHCRGCGKIFCDDCVSQKVKLQGTEIVNGRFHPGYRERLGACAKSCCACQRPCTGICNGSPEGCKNQCVWSCCGQTGRSKSWPGCKFVGKEMNNTTVSYFTNAEQAIVGSLTLVCSRFLVRLRAINLNALQQLALEAGISDSSWKSGRVVCKCSCPSASYTSGVLLISEGRTYLPDYSPALSSDSLTLPQYLDEITLQLLIPSGLLPSHAMLKRRRLRASGASDPASPASSSVEPEIRLNLTFYFISSSSVPLKKAPSASSLVSSSDNICVANILLTQCSLSLDTVEMSDKSIQKTIIAEDDKFEPLFQRKKKNSESTNKTKFHLPVDDSIWLQSQGTSLLLVNCKRFDPASNDLPVVENRDTGDSKSMSDSWVWHPLRPLSELKFRLPGVAVAVFDSGKDLINISLMNLLYRQSSYISNIDTEIRLGHLQIDNYFSRTEGQKPRFPILLAPSPLPSELWMPFLQASWQQLINPRVSTKMFSGFTILMQKIDLSIEEAVIWAIVGFVGSILEPRQSAQSKVEGTQEHDFSIPFSVLTVAPACLQDESLQLMTRLFFKELVLQAISINLNFEASPVMRTGSLSKVFSKKGSSIFSTMLSVVSTVFSPLLAVAGSIDGVPLRMNQKLFKNFSCSQSSLVSDLTQHYTRQGLMEVYKVLGSFEFLGNPVGLISDIKEGLTDFFVEPMNGAISSPEDFGKGVAKGTGSLLTKLTRGVFGAASKTLNSVSKGVAALSFDDEFVASRQASSGSGQPKHALYGVAQGAKSLGTGIFKGITGVVLDPLKGAQRDGLTGFVKGIGTGIVGVATKPISGAVDFASSTLSGIGNTAGFLLSDVEPNKPMRSTRRFHEIEEVNENL